MSPRRHGHGRDRKARGWGGADQARPTLTRAARPAAALVLVLALGACSDRWSELDPRPVVANILGAHLEGREPPPGLDGPYPRLSSVPARPAPPDAAARARLSSALADDRAASRQPAGIAAAPRAPAPGAGPPPPPRLAAVPVIAPDPPTPTVPAAPAAPLPAAPAPAETPPPAAAPPPPPPRDLLAPPPPPSADLLAPRRAGRDPL